MTAYHNSSMCILYYHIASNVSDDVLPGQGAACRSPRRGGSI